MGVDTLGFVMIAVFVEGAPLSFKIKHIEVVVFLHAVNQSGSQLLVAVGEGTVVTIVALVQMLWELCTVL